MPFHRTVDRLVVTSMTVFAVAMAPATADAANVSIKGQVTKGSGMTVVAVSPSGVGKAAKLKRNGKFSLKLRSGAKGATLHLIKKTGGYYGPVVLAKSKRKGFAAIKGSSVDVGTIKLKGSYAITRKAVAKSKLLTSRYAKLSAKGKPLGAGRLGVRGTTTAKRLRLSGSSSPDPGVDGDRDGLPNAFDADDDGDGLLDTADASGTSVSGAGLFTSLFLHLQSTVNANAGVASQAAIDAAVRDNLSLVLFLDDQMAGSGGAIQAVDADCFALVYCRRGDGTALVYNLSDTGTTLTNDSPWIAYDPNANGLPNIPAGVTRTGVHALGLSPRVTTSQISPGDVINLLWDRGAASVVTPTAVTFYFVTVPAITSYNAGSGPVTVTYPAGGGAAGSDSNPIVMTGNSLTLNFWRPQRAAIPGAESGDLTDMGHLGYGLTVELPGRQFGCPDDYSALSSTLSRRPGSSSDPQVSLFSLIDSASDATPNPANTMSFTVDLGACLARNGVTASGQTFRLTLTAAGESRPGGNDRAAQQIRVSFP